MTQQQTKVFTIGETIAVLYQRRHVVLWTILAALILVLGIVTLVAGKLGIGMGDIIALFGGESSPTATFVLENLRGPRLLVAILAGAAFGLSGALFQTVTRNPLGSPDVLGLAAGAGAGVAVVSLFPTGLPTPIGALAGAGVAIGLVAIATGSGFTSPSRVILAGIAVAAMATAITQFVVTATLRDEASRLAAYLVGSLNARDLGHAGLICLALLIALPLLIVLNPRLQLMELGDELATSLGGKATTTRTWAIVASLMLAAMAVAVAGPIAFIALMSPHAARMLTRSTGPNLVTSALVGAVLLVLADLSVQQLPVLDGLPVGIITAGFGGIFLGYLLLREFRKGHA
ncbi:FecCD family ABC transporter permease [Enteractinococcus coprophilus]|uniref:Iron complex transport system permease protein n=1 Tax=Enteractinococcus coprophilus TaxID=1027633 RepID=A0A543AGR9_9MICC|nr:iron chelate uptake ABC transporter family permease subunit [Enteractinococcus coprophilus]TQL71771.1 iron complex transport system permease protein [Enteractinococcus coprophilus]